MHFDIELVHARQILDSRGNPTLECEVALAGGGTGRAAGVEANHQRLALVHQALEQLEYPVRRDRVQVACRFVGDDDRRVVSQRPSDGRPLLLSAAEPAGQLVRLVGDAHLLQQMHRSLLALAPLVDVAKVHG